MAEPLRQAQSYFSDKAQAYRESKTHANAAELARMVEWLQPRPGARALDVATGGGHTAMALAEAGCDVIATDATPSMLQDWPPLPRAVCDAERIPFRRASLDIVASRIAPHHFPDLRLFAQEASRVLRAGGRLYVFDLTTPDDAEVGREIDHLERLRDPSHVHSHSPSEWKDALARGGLRVARLETTASVFDLEPWIGRARMPPAREAELRRLLRERPAQTRGGYGLTPDGRMRVLRVELLAEVRP